MSEDAVLFAKKAEELEAVVLQLREEIAWLKRHMFGTKSERNIAAHTGQLTLAQWNDVPPPAAPVQAASTAVAKEKSKPVRKPLDESKHAILTEELHPEGNRDEMKLIGVEETTYRELVDARIVLRKIKRYKYRNTITGEIIIADMPYRPFAKSSVSTSIVSEVVVQKYVDAMPIYRQQQAWQRLGVSFPYASLSDMQRAGYDVIKPLFDAFKKDLLTSNYIQLDESPFKVLSSEKKGSTHVGYQWVHLDPVRNLVFYNYQPGRAQEHPTNMLKGYKGIIQTDGYAGYNQVAARSDIEQMYCMAHARRYFEKALDNDPERAAHFLAEVRKLYEVERHIRDQELHGDQITDYRSGHAIPILQELQKWLDQQHHQVIPKSPIGKAVQYARQHWHGLTTYCKYPYTFIDNNPIERSIRPMVVGRKNYLFAGSHESAEVAACYYSMFITCRLHGVNPKNWMADVFEKVELMKPSQYHTLFPQNWGK